MAKKIAEQLIDTLAESGVERIYAVTGDSLNEVNEAVRKNNKIKWIHVRHEETGAYAAAAEAQLTGRPGCCAGSSGPGHVHLINGLYDAQRSGAPVIAIASTIPSREFGTEYFQETNTIKFFNDCSYYNEVATTPKQFPRMLQSAIQTAITRKGVAVVALCGDGGLSMTLGDLATVVQYKLPIKIIVFNNRSLGMVKLEMEVDGLPDWQTNMLNPDFAQVAEAMGITGFNVSDPEEVLTTLYNAFEMDGPVLVNIMTDPNALAMPPKIEFGQMVGFAQSMYKLLINGRSQEVIDTINSNYKHIREVF